MDEGKHYSTKKAIQNRQIKEDSFTTQNSLSYGLEIATDARAWLCDGEKPSLHDPIPKVPKKSSMTLLRVFVVKPYCYPISHSKRA